MCEMMHEKCYESFSSPAAEIENLQFFMVSNFQRGILNIQQIPHGH